LIEGAHTGSGLGAQFLRHIERTRLLVHMVDVSDGSGRPDVAKDVEVILGELASFGAGLEKKPTLMVASKIDVANPEKLKKAEAVGYAQQAQALSHFGGNRRGHREAEVCHGRGGGKDAQGAGGLGTGALIGIDGLSASSFPSPDGASVLRGRARISTALDPTSRILF
jgi:hypothetical protein